MSRLKKRDLKTRLFLIVFGSTVLIGVFTVLLMFYIVSRYSQQEDEQQVQQLLDTVEYSAAIASYTSNSEIADDVINGLMRSNHVCQARLSNKTGLLVEQAKYTNLDVCSPIISRTLHSPFDNKEIIGQIDTRLDNQVIQSIAYRHALDLALSLLALVLLPGVIIWREVSRYITKPIHRLSQQMHLIVPGTDARIVPVTRQNEDEITQLVMDVNGLLTVVQDTLNEEREQRALIEKMEQKYQHLAHHDMLTGLPNRSLFNDRLQQMLAHAKRDALHSAVIFLDLNKFKPINDTLGHDIGDLVLKEVAQRLLAAVRESDTVARLGGDEFVVLLPVVEHHQDALMVADKIRLALELPITINAHTLTIGASIGLAIYPDHGEEEITLIKNADTAMYQAKQSNDNKVKMHLSNTPTTV